MITAFERFSDVTNSDNTPSDRLSLFLEEITRQVNKNTVLSGSGSPESVISAEVTALYMDAAGTAGSILYVKKTGAGNTGWILV